MSLMQSLKKSPGALRRRLHRGRVEEALSHGDPLFKVQYLGTEQIYSLELEQAEEAIQRLLENVTAEPRAQDHALVVRPRYVEVKELSTGRQLTKTFLQDIALCAADKTRPNVFLYVCRQRGQQLHCRAFWCRRAERARDLTACLAQSFQRALNDWQDDAGNQNQGAGPKGRGTDPKRATLSSNLRKANSLE